MLTQKEGYWKELYLALSSRYHAERCILPGVPRYPRRKWKRILIIMGLQALHVPKILKRICTARGKVLLVCTTAPFTALIAGLAAHVIIMRPKIFLYNFYIHELGGSALVRAVLRLLLSQNVCLLVQSPNEVAWFKSINPKLKVEYYPYCQGRSDEALVNCEQQAGYIFAGGGTNRDYSLLIEVAIKLSCYNFVIVRSSANVLPTSLPSNLLVYTDITSKRFQMVMV